MTIHQYFNMRIKPTVQMRYVILLYTSETSYMFRPPFVAIFITQYLGTKITLPYCSRTGVKRLRVVTKFTADIETLRLKIPARQIRSKLYV
jgi:hypothetical protein